MILCKNKNNELCLIGNQSLEWYSDYKLIEVLKDLPVQLRRIKCSDTLKEIKKFQIRLRNKAINELELRHKLIDIIDNLEHKQTER